MKERLDKHDWHYAGQYKSPLLYQSEFLPTVKKRASGGLRVAGMGRGIVLDGHNFVRKTTWERCKAAARQGNKTRAR